MRRTSTMTLATPSARTMWKGAISFGLVHIPIGLYTATAETRPKFNLIDKESNSPVGNRQVSKATGEVVDTQDLAKGLKVGEGEYVTLSKEEIRSALPRSTQLIEIERFVPAKDIPSVFFNKPYYVEPSGRGQKAYVLLRDTLTKTGMVGLARVVVSTKQHLAALMPLNGHLVLNLLRWEEEVRAAPALNPELGATAPTDREYQMAEQLVRNMADAWAPDLFHDEFREQLQKLVETKKQAGDITQVQPLPGQEIAALESAEVMDLTELLKRSLTAGAGEPVKPAAPPKKPAASRRVAQNDETGERRAVAASKPAQKARTTTKVEKPSRKPAQE